jgi:CRP/FNR family transcriptional regulator, cyclic AMP receptor protein
MMTLNADPAAESSACLEGPAPAERRSIGTLPFFVDAPTDVVARLDAAARWFTYEAASLIVDFDDETTDVYFILEGAVRVILRAPNGKERLLGEIGAGQFFGEMSAIDDSGRSANVTALTRTRVCILRGQAFLEAVHASRTTCRRLLRMLSGRIRSANARLLEDATLPGRLRLAAELLRMSAPSPMSGVRTIRPVPLESDLSARIGIRREAVSRSISELRRQGLLERLSDALVLPDPVALQQTIQRHLEEIAAMAEPARTARPGASSSEDGR